MSNQHHLYNLTIKDNLRRKIDVFPIPLLKIYVQNIPVRVTSFNSV